MFKFVKEGDDHMVQYSILSEHVTLHEINEAFKYFLLACGYSVPSEEDGDNDDV